MWWIWRWRGRVRRRSATARVGLGLSGRDREDVRWYLEDYLQYPVDPAPDIAREVETRLAELGEELFRQVFEANRDTIRIWEAVAADLAGARVEVATGAEGAAGIPWELLRDPATGGVVSLRAGAFVRGPAAGRGSPCPAGGGGLRVLLVICRPGGAVDVPFRSVASSTWCGCAGRRGSVLELEVLRPPTFAQLARCCRRPGTGVSRIRWCISMATAPGWMTKR